MHDRQGTDGPAPANSQYDWYIGRDGQQFGPVTVREMQEIIARGHLSPDDHVWRPGFENWMRASDVAGLLRPPTNPPKGPPPNKPDGAIRPQFNGTASAPLLDGEEILGPSKPIVQVVKNDVASQPDPKLVGIRGWLLLLCVGLTIFGPILTFAAIGQTYAEMDKMRPLFGNLPGLEAFFKGTIVLLFLLILASVLIGVRLWTRRPGAHIEARWLMASSFLIGCVAPFSIYLFVDMPAGVAPKVLDAWIPDLIKSAVPTVLWYSYLLRSKRVRATFGPH